MTTIGFGDIAIISDNEKVLVIIIMFMATCLYGYTLNKISSIILEMDSTNHQYKM